MRLARYWLSPSGVRPRVPRKTSPQAPSLRLNLATVFGSARLFGSREKSEGTSILSFPSTGLWVRPCCRPPHLGCSSWSMVNCLLFARGKSHSQTAHDTKGRRYQTPNRTTAGCKVIGTAEFLLFLRFLFLAFQGTDPIVLPFVSSLILAFTRSSLASDPFVASRFIIYARPSRH